jgi:hypothetical protein
MIACRDLRSEKGIPRHRVVETSDGPPRQGGPKRRGHDQAMLLKVFAKRTKKADAKAAEVIGTLTQEVLGQGWVEPFRRPQAVPGESLQ